MMEDSSPQTFIINFFFLLNKIEINVFGYDIDSTTNIYSEKNKEVDTLESIKDKNMPDVH
jgi:hypothetical protein